MQNREICIEEEDAARRVGSDQIVGSLWELFYI